MQSGDFIIPSGQDDSIGVAVSLDELTIEQSKLVVGQALESSSEQDMKLVKTLVGVP